MPSRQLQRRPSAKTDQALGPTGGAAGHTGQAQSGFCATPTRTSRMRSRSAPPPASTTSGPAVTTGLNLLYNVHYAAATQLVSFGVGAQPTALEHGPTPGSATRSTSSTRRPARSAGSIPAPPTRRPRWSSRPVTAPGGATIGSPRLLAVGGLDLLIVDARGDLWTGARPTPTASARSRRCALAATSCGDRTA